MDDQEQDHTNSRPTHNSGATAGDQRTEPVRSRWTPKPEQILILESIFNSGMVNPPKDETVRIRKLLEKFGAVGDANVFYWFQNRRSRSRRRQRQIQASLSAGEQPQRGGGGAIQYENTMSTGNSSLAYNNYPMNSSGSSSSCGLAGSDHGDYLSFSGQTGMQEQLDQSSVFGTSDCSSLHYQSELITVFINGVATEVGKGPLDMKSMFGGDFVLFHSSGVPIQVNEYGFLMQSLQHGESYFLVPRQ